MSKKDIVIIGASGFAKEILWLLEQNNKKIEEKWNILGFIDSNNNNKSILGYNIIGDDDWLLNYENKIYVVCGIGSPSLRKKVIQKFLHKENIIFPNIISYDAVVSSSVKMGAGCIICSHSILTVDIQLGDFVTINLDCTVGHDSVIDDFTTLHPSVNVSGNVHIESETEVGTGTHIIQGITIGKRVRIGAGAVVIRDIPSYSTAVGNPAKIIKVENIE